MKDIKLTPEEIFTALLNQKIIVAAMLKSMTEKHGKLVDFQKSDAIHMNCTACQTTNMWW